MIDIEKIESLQDNLIKETDENDIYETINSIIEYKATDTSIENTLLVLNKKLSTFRLLGLYDNSIRENSRKYFMYSIHKAFSNLTDLLEAQREVFEVRRLTGILASKQFLNDYNYEEFSMNESKTYDCYINGVWLPNLLYIMYWSETLIEVIEKLVPYVECRVKGAV